VVYLAAEGVISAAQAREYAIVAHHPGAPGALPVIACHDDT
jgi:hypothetical protein